MTEVLKLFVVDLSSPDRSSTAASIRQACTDYGFFYLVNHGVEEELFQKVFEESKKLFSLPLDEKMKMARKNRRSYTPLFAENLDPESGSKGDSRESYSTGPLEDVSAQIKLNCPSEEILPSWRPTMETFYRKALDAGKTLLVLIAVALNLDEDFFARVGAMDKPAASLRLLHYPGELRSCNEETYGASAHSDYGMITLLASNGVRGLQGKIYATTGVGRCSSPRWAAFFLNTSEDCVVECLECRCSESCPPRFPPIRSGNYLKERFMLTYGSYGGLKNAK